MAIDPISGLGLDGSSVQIIEFFSKLGTNSQEIYRSLQGLSRDQEQYERIARELVDLCANLRSDPTSISDLTTNDQKLRSLAEKCQKEAEDFLSLLENFKVQGTKTAPKSVKQAFRGLLKQDELQKLINHMTEHRNELGIILLKKLRRVTRLIVRC